MSDELYFAMLVISMILRNVKTQCESNLMQNVMLFPVTLVGGFNKA